MTFQSTFALFLLFTEPLHD